PEAAGCDLEHRCDLENAQPFRLERQTPCRIAGEEHIPALAEVEVEVAPRLAQRLPTNVCEKIARVAGRVSPAISVQVDQSRTVAVENDMVATKRAVAGHERVRAGRKPAYFFGDAEQPRRESRVGLGHCGQERVYVGQ